MKSKNIAACVLGISALCLGSEAKAQSVIYDNTQAVGNTGNQSGFDLGMEFTVNTPVTVTALGTFDGNIASYAAPVTQAQIATSLGPTYYSSDDPFTIQVAIYTAKGTLFSTIANFNYAGALANAGTANQYFAIHGSIFQPISPLVLPAGNYFIVASGYTFGYESGNTSPTVSVPPSLTPSFNTLSGALTLTANGGAFNGTQANGGIPLAFPTNTVGIAELNNAPDFLAGTFIAQTNGTAVAPDGGTTMALLGCALVGTEALRRKFKR